MVTGGSRGIGRAIAIELARAGARVVVGYRQAQSEAESVAEEVRALGAEGAARRLDVTCEEEVRAVVSSSLDRFGSLDVLVCNAGVLDDGLAATMTLRSWEAVLDVNLRGAFLCIREAVPQMLRQRRGSIVAVSSIAAEHPGRGHCNYAASKGGLNALVRALAVELGPKNIRVNAVAPGLIETDMTAPIRRRAEDQIRSRSALRRIGHPDEVARAVRFLASDDASFITGEVLNVSGGYGL